MKNSWPKGETDALVEPPSPINYTLEQGAYITRR